MFADKHAPSPLLNFEHVLSFHDGMQLLAALQDPGVILLLPHVHESCALATLKDGFELLPNFVMAIPNPPLYLATKHSSACQTTNNRIAAIPILFVLISGATPPDKFAVHSTQEAARLVVNGECRFCITNSDGIKKYELEILKELKQTTVLWLPFRYTA